MKSKSLQTAVIHPLNLKSAVYRDLIGSSRSVWV